MVNVDLNNDRYNRQKIIANWDQEKLSQKTVTIIGLGALGTYIGASLAMAGVGKLILIDFDTVEVSNLNRQLFYYTDDVGKWKVNVCIDRWKQINPDVMFEGYTTDFREVPTEKIASSDIVVEGLDTFDDRRWINAFCVSNNIPLVSGGIYGFWGNVQLVIPHQTPCLECHTLISHEELQKACTPFGLPRKTLKKENDNQLIIPSISSVSMVIGGIMANEVLKFLLGFPYLDNYLFWDGESSSFTKIKLKRRTDCFVCSKKYSLQEIIFHAPKDISVRKFANQVSYSFNLDEDFNIFFKTRLVPIDGKLLRKIIPENQICHIIASRVPYPLKFKIVYDG